MVCIWAVQWIGLVIKKRSNDCYGLHFSNKLTTACKSQSNECFKIINEILIAKPHSGGILISDCYLLCVIAVVIGIGKLLSYSTI